MKQDIIDNLLSSTNFRVDLVQVRSSEKSARVYYKLTKPNKPGFSVVSDDLIELIKESRGTAREKEWLHDYFFKDTGPTDAEDSFKRDPASEL